MATSTHNDTMPAAPTVNCSLAFTKGERIAIGRRGYALSRMLRNADANVPMRGLLDEALHLRCYEAVAAALHLWDVLNAAERAAIQRRADDWLAPAALASRIESTDRLAHLIKCIADDLSRETRRARIDKKRALIDAYREELALRTMGPRAVPTTTELTTTEKNKLLAIRARAIGSEYAA